jgi:hypothetical protein
MRTRLMAGLILVLFAVPAAQAQQAPEAPQTTVAVPNEAVPAAVQAPAQLGDTRVTAQIVESRALPVEAAAQREMSARNLLAIVGAVVVVIALLVFLRS